MTKEATLPGKLTGSFLVRALRPAFRDAHRVLPRMRDRGVLRRHSLKLRFWPSNHPVDDNGTLLDLDWGWIEAIKSIKVGELRIKDTIGGCDNLRVIFFVPPNKKPTPIIWVLAVMQKKSDQFSKANISTFKLRRGLVLERFYNAK